MNKAIIAKNAPAAVGPYVHAVQAGSLLFVSGQLGLDPVSGDVVKTTVFIDDMNDFVKVNEIYAKYFDECKPARSCVEVAKLPKGGLVEIECIASK